MHRNIILILMCIAPVPLSYSSETATSINCFSPAHTEQTKTAITNALFSKDTELSRRQARNRSQCLIDISKLDKLPHNFKFIDISKDSANSAATMNNMLAIPINQVKLTTFLQNRPFVLVSSGFELHDALQECGNLRDQGFKDVYVLKDGLLALANKSKKIQNEFVNRLVEPRQLFNELRERNWIVAYIGTTDVQALKRYLPDGARFISVTKLEQTLAVQRNTTLPTGIIVLDQYGEKIQTFAELTKKIDRSDVFYLQTGVEGFNKYINTQYQMTSKREFVLQKPQSCAR